MVGRADGCISLNLSTPSLFPLLWGLAAALCNRPRSGWFQNRSLFITYNAPQFTCRYIRLKFFFNTSIPALYYNRTSIFVCFCFLFSQFCCRSVCVFLLCVFFFPRKSSHAIHSFDFRAVIFSFLAPERKKNSFFIHSSEFLKKRTKTSLSR